MRLRSPTGGRLLAPAPASACDAGRPRYGRGHLAWLIFAGFALLYLATLSANLSIAHDSPAYAAGILRLAPSFHPNHLLYEPTLAGLAWLLQRLGAPSEPWTVEIAGALAGAATLAAAYLTQVRRLDVPAVVAAAAVAGAGFSFGVWYYSVAVEIYIYPLCFLAWSLYLLLDARGRPATVVAAAALQSAAVLFHQTAVLFSAVPVVVLLGDRGRPLGRRLGRRLGLLATYATVGAAIVGGAYLTVAAATGHAGSAAALWTWLLGYGTQAQYWSPLGPEAVLLAGVGFGRAVIGGHFVFAIPTLRESIEDFLRENSLDDEAYLVQGYAGAAADTLLSLSVLWVVAAAVCLALAAVGAARLLRSGRGAAQVPLLAWLVPYTLFFTA